MSNKIFKLFLKNPDLFSDVLPRLISLKKFKVPPVVIKPDLIPVPCNIFTPHYSIPFLLWQFLQGIQKVVLVRLATG